MGNNDFHLFLRKTQIDADDITDDRDDEHMQKYDHVIRVFKSSPNGACLQLRTYGPTRPRGKPRRVLAAADYLDVDQLDTLIAHLKTVREAIS